jgi:ribosome-binding protein aMBF1 (putative translation factor)
MAKAWKELRGKGKLSKADLKRIDSEVERDVIEITVREMREELGLTQSQLAEALKMMQPDISRLERRDDHLISTLRKVVEAMGGELEVTAKFGAKRFRVA